MALLRFKDAKKMSKTEREARLKELKFELVRSSVGANKANSKKKEIKKAISRLLTLNKSITTSEALKSK